MRGDLSGIRVLCKEDACDVCNACCIPQRGLQPGAFILWAGCECVRACCVCVCVCVCMVRECSCARDAPICRLWIFTFCTRSWLRCAHRATRSIFRTQGEVLATADSSHLSRPRRDFGNGEVSEMARFLATARFLKWRGYWLSPSF